MKIFAILDVSNRYQNKIYADGRLLATGNNGLEELQLVTRGKRTMVQLTLSNAEIILVNERCPKIVSGATCELLRITSTACDGCPKREVNK